MTTPINPLPIPPTPADSPVDFNTKAFALLGALPAFVAEANAQASGLDAAVLAAETEADAAALKAGEALTSANNAALSKTGADSARDAAALSAASALDSKNAAQTARTGAEAAAAAAHGGIKAYATRAEAAVAAALLPDGADIEVAQDESLSGARTRYKAQGGVLVFAVNLDQTRIDLANGNDPAKGAALVGYMPDGTGAVERTVHDKLSDTDSLKDFSSIMKAAEKSVITVTPGVFLISENVVIPNTVKFSFRGGRIRIAAGVTVTWNARIDAGHEQIFEFEDATSDLLPTRPTRSGETSYRGDVYLAWFGAVGNAYFGDKTAVDAIPYGADSTAAIKRAVRFANAASVPHSNYNYGACAPLVAEPNAQYFVSGDNILGCQITDLIPVDLNSHWIRFLFEGNGCTFYWKPLVADDAFFAEQRHIEQPEAKNFSVRLCGFSGMRGRFLEYIQTAGLYSGWRMPRFQRVFVSGGVDDFARPGFGNLLERVFHVQDASDSYGKRGDSVMLEDCYFEQFTRFAYIDALEAVGWMINGGQALSRHNGCIWFDNPSSSSGTMNLTGWTPLMKGPNHTFIRSRMAAFVAGRNGNWNIENCRPETNNVGAAFTLVDADAGTFIFDSFVANNGAGGGIGASAYIAKIAQGASVYMRNCTGLPNKVLMESLDPIGAAQANAWVNSYHSKWQIHFQNCNTANNEQFNFRWHRLGQVEELDYRTITRIHEKWVRPIKVADSIGQHSRVKDVTHGSFQGSKKVDRHRVRLGSYAGTGGQYLTIAGSATELFLPANIAIRSCRVIAQTMPNLDTVDSIRVRFGVTNGATGTAELAIDVPLSTVARTNAEIVLGTGKSAIIINTDPAADIQNYRVNIEARKSGATANSNISGFVEIEYEGICDGGGGLWNNQTGPVLT